MARSKSSASSGTIGQSTGNGAFIRKVPRKPSMPRKPDHPRPKPKEAKSKQDLIPENAQAPPPAHRRTQSAAVHSFSPSITRKRAGSAASDVAPHIFPQRSLSVVANDLSDEEEDEQFKRHHLENHNTDSIEDLKEWNAELEEEVVFLRKRLLRMEKKYMEKINGIIEAHQIENNERKGIQPVGRQSSFSRLSSVSAPLGIAIEWPLSRILDETPALNLLIQYSESKYCPEPVKFWKDVKVFDAETDKTKSYGMAEIILKRYITAGSDLELNVMHGDKKKIALHVGPGKTFKDGIPKNLFDNIKKEALTLMKTNVYGSFVNGDTFKEFIDNY